MPRRSGGFRRRLGALCDTIVSWEARGILKFKQTIKADFQWCHSGGQVYCYKFTLHCYSFMLLSFFHVFSACVNFLSIFFFFLQKVEGAQESVYPAERRLSIFKIKHEKSLREQTITCRSICQILSSRKLKKARIKTPLDQNSRRLKSTMMSLNID